MQPAPVDLLQRRVQPASITANVNVQWSVITESKSSEHPPVLSPHVNDMFAGGAAPSCQQARIAALPVHLMMSVCI